MRRPRLLGITLMAILSLTAIAATTQAYAENPLILPEPTATKPLTFTGTANLGTLETTKGALSVCTSETSSGSFTTGRTGTITIDYTGCHSVISGVGEISCHSLGDKTTTILTGGTISIIDQDIGGKLMPGVLVTLASLLHIECALGILILMLGAVIGLITKINGAAISEPAEGTTKEDKAKELTLAFTQTKGEQGSKTCALPKATCEGKTFLLETKVEEAEELEGLAATSTVKFGEEKTLDY
jgi:hypothetical protein